MLARQSPSGREPAGFDRLPAGVSRQPAIPRRVAPQQSPPPLHRSPTIVADPARAIKCAARPHRKGNVVLPAVFAAAWGVISALHAG
jgi:hypothetical protein